MTFTVVTPWRNHMEYARDYWTAVRAAGCDVIVVDNASDPPLPNAFRLDYNGGYAHASNLGLRLARTDAVLFLNNDIQATRLDWLDPIRDALEPGVLVGANLRCDQHGDVDGIRLPYLDGWCLAGMRDDLLELGGFDEAYEEPSYYSDNDLCLRARDAGMSLVEVRTGLVHKVNGTSADDPAGMQAASVRNRSRFHRVARQILEMEVAA